MTRKHRHSHRDALRYTLSLDLHGLTVKDAREQFIRFYNSAFIKHAGPLEIIHGYGAGGAGGAIRSMIRSLVSRYPECCEMVPGEHIDGNHGYTLLYPRGPLPTSEDKLENDILCFCSTPKTMTKIINKFRSHGQPNIRNTVRILKQKKLLMETTKGRHKVFQSDT